MTRKEEGEDSEKKENGEERSLVAALCRDDNERLEAGAGG
jgi:hypothetical protein